MGDFFSAHREWASRPADERFTSLHAMSDHFNRLRDASRERIVSNRKLTIEPLDTKQIVITGPNGHAYAPTHWSFGQLSSLVGAPASYLRTLPAPMVADNLNYGLQFHRQAEDVGVLISLLDDKPVLRAATGPAYGRVWNADILRQLTGRFGDGVTGQWKVPGEFSRAVHVTKDNTTLFASDRDMFIFLADEERRIEVPNRRNGQPGSMARGFYVWNSEVGSQTLGIATFLFDFACANRIICGGRDYKEIKVRHTKSAPDRFIEEVAPAVARYAEGSARGVTEAIEDARKHRFEGDALDAFLAQRFTKSEMVGIKAAHLADEDRPIENAWDVVVGATAYARGIEHQDSRVDIEKKAGRILERA